MTFLIPKVLVCCPDFDVSCVLVVCTCRHICISICINSDIPDTDEFAWEKKDETASKIETKDLVDATVDEEAVKDSIVILAPEIPYPPPKNVPLDTTIQKKTPPGEEQSQIGGKAGLSHLYKPKQRTSPDGSSEEKLTFTSVPYAASMYDRKGEAIQFQTKRDPNDVRTSKTGHSVGQKSSILAGASKRSSQALVGEKPVRMTKSAGTRPIRPVSTKSDARNQPSSIRSQSASTKRTVTVTSPGAQASLTKPPPEEFICPITKDVMRHPVKCSDGRSYEKKAISDWLDKSSTSPVSGETIIDSTMPPDNDLKAQIKAWKKERMEAVLLAAKVDIDVAEKRGKSVGSVEC